MGFHMFKDKRDSRNLTIAIPLSKERMGKTNNKQKPNTGTWSPQSSHSKG